MLVAENEQYDMKARGRGDKPAFRGCMRVEYWVIPYPLYKCRATCELSYKIDSTRSTKSIPKTLGPAYRCRRDDNAANTRSRRRINSETTKMLPRMEGE